jgi:hypothetical protein
MQAMEPLQDDPGRDWPQQAQVNLIRLKGNVDKAASIAGDLERQLAAKSSGCAFAKQAADKIDQEIPAAATATENSLKALLAETKTRLTSLTSENKALGWIGWRGSREEAISEMSLLGHDVTTTAANADLAFTRLRNATTALDRSNASCRLGTEPYRPGIETCSEFSDISHMEPTLEQMARLLAESGDYRVTSRLGPQDEYHPPDNLPKLVAAVVDVETTGTNPDRDKIIELGVCLFEYDRVNGRVYRVLGSWEWFEDPGISIPAEITKITGITYEMVAGHYIDDRAVNDLLDRVVLVIAHNADFDRRFLEKRLPGFSTKHWACSRSDIDWKAEGVRSSALEFVAYRLGFFHDAHRAASDCRATVHALTQNLPTTGRMA